jgi:hypothetical protein
MVAPAFYSSSLGSNLDISQKYKMGHIGKGVTSPLIVPACLFYRHFVWVSDTMD